MSNDCQLCLSAISFFKPFQSSKAITQTASDLINSYQQQLPSLLQAAMERNDLSFSLPTWHRQQIRSLTMREQQSLYASSPFNLNDFKSESPTADCIFHLEEDSPLKEYSSKRRFNSTLQLELAFFMQFVLEAIIWETDSEREGGSVIGRLKQLMYKVDLCKFQNVPEDWRKYYRNEVVKKIFFQYLGKCVYNLSLVELLLLTNGFLRFSIVLFIKNCLFEQNLISSYHEQLSFGKMALNMADCFELLMQDPAKGINSKGKFFVADERSVKSPHYLLIQQNGHLFLYRKELKLASSNIPQREIQKKQPVQDKSKRDSTLEKTKDKTNKPRASLKSRKVAEVRERHFWDCLPCFSSKR